ncbi:MAG: hypothetical protein ACTSYI_08375 [Promethearchaeota archaeon]
MAEFFLEPNFDISIFILGSYHTEENLPELKTIKDFLKYKNFTNTYLASDPADFKINPNSSRDQQNYEKVEYLLSKSDFCLFIFFENYNDSLKTELISFLKSQYDSKINKKYLIIKPYSLKIDSMLSGLMDQQEVNIFQYNDVSEIAKYCFKYIKFNSLQD